MFRSVYRSRLFPLLVLLTCCTAAPAVLPFLPGYGR